MKRSLFNAPPSTDPFGLPTGKYWSHTFPPDMSAATTVLLTLNGVKKKLISFSDGKLKPNRHPKQPDKLPRHTEIMLRFPQKTKAIKLFLNLNSQIAFLVGKIDTDIMLGPEILAPSEAHIINYYEKKDKRKVLNACFFGPGHPVTDMHLAMTKCEVVVAVDTNSRDVPGIGKVSATTAIEAYFKEITEESCHMQSGPMRQKITIDPPGNPEIYGIGTIMLHLFETNPQLRKKRVGIITDTEFNLIKGMGQRTVPFFKTMILPDNIDLFYATSDSGSSEFFANKLIRMCDNASTAYLNKYLSDHSHQNSG